MRPPVLRLFAVAVIAQLATACASYSAFNPFDDDPNGPPPAPHLFADADDGPPIIDSRSGNRAEYRVAEVESPRSSVTRRNDYGTGEIESAPLPPPGGAVRPPPGGKPPYEIKPQEEIASAAPPAESGGSRTLRTGRNKPAEPSATPASAETRETRTLVHKVRAGEELADIADTYHVREVDIIKANDMRPPYKLAKGQELRVPVVGVAGPGPGDPVTAGDPVEPKAKPAATEKRQRTETARADGAPRFDWPVSGKVISPFGARGNGLYNEGINIAVSPGTPVRASAGGVVRYAGNELRGYGNLILIEHEGGFVTAYAHNDSLSVKRGERVERGQVIAKSGQTGNVKSPQLHFEIRKGTQSVDPSKYLTS